MFRTSTRTMWSVLLLLLMWGGVPLTGSQCERSSAVRFSVSSWRNQTGHRLVAVELRSDDSLEDAVSLSVDQWTERCGAADTVALSVIASSAGSSSAATTTIPTTPVPTTSNPVTARPTARSDYRHLPGLGYYKLHLKQLPWDEARRSCEREGAYLAVLDSKEEYDALYNLTGCCFWIGVHRKDPTGPWMTVLGQPLNSCFNMWSSRQPSGPSSCAFLYASDGLANSDCESKKTFLCELYV